MRKMSIKTYSELILLPTFKERFNYLKLNGFVGEDTFGFDRYLNQAFYKSIEWQNVRNYVIYRDNACDLGILDREIYGNILIHHMNPINKEDVLERRECIWDPEYLICVTHNTHNALHYGNEDGLMLDIAERSKNDTSPWRR